jgi:hypothetical protein
MRVDDKGRKYYSVYDLERIWGLSFKTWDRYMTQGMLPYYWVGGWRYVREDDLEKFVKKCVYRRVEGGRKR